MNAGKDLTFTSANLTKKRFILQFVDKAQFVENCFVCSY